jgi:uncharacterized membrane protein
VNRRSVHVLISAVVVVAALVGFFPHLRHFIWLGVFWGIVAVLAIAVVSVVINILSVMFSMYTGYRPTIEDAASASSGMPGEVLRFGWASGDGEPQAPSNRLAEAMVELRGAECAPFNLAGSGAFQEFRDKQKHQCYQALEEVQTLIQEVSKDTVHEEVAS